MTEKAQAELNARFIQGAITLLGRSDNGAWHRSIEVARRLVAYGIWDGEERIEFDAYLLHDKMFGVAQVSPLDLVAGKDYRFPDRRQPIKLGPKWPNQASRRTSRIGGQTRYEIAWFSPDGEALASLYVHPDRARIELVGGSVIADSEGDSARDAYRAADRDLRLFRQDPADLLGKLARAERQVKRLQQSYGKACETLAYLRRERDALQQQIDALQQQIEEETETSVAVIGRLNRRLNERMRLLPTPADAVRLLVFDPTSREQLAEANDRIGELVLAGWRVEQMTSSEERTCVLMTNPRAQLAPPPPRREVAR
ncbi:MAG: hypothetical protein GX484_05265 [Chloroflexi bacterium]|nr:hypothetical protein [Chloroflexota bacterium]